MQATRPGLYFASAIGCNWVQLSAIGGNVVQGRTESFDETSGLHSRQFTYLKSPNRQINYSRLQTKVDASWTSEGLG